MRRWLWAWLSALAVVAGENYGSLSREDRQRLGFERRRYASKPGRHDEAPGEVPRLGPAARRARDAIRAVARRDVDDDGDSKAMCLSKAKTGTKRTGPRYGPIEWSRGGEPSAEGLECVASRGAGRVQACCRATEATVASLSEHWGKHLTRIARFAAKSEGVSLEAAAREWRCLPSIVVIGAQKSGSTALAGHLMHHPLVDFGRAKELHFFDKNETQCLGPLPYLLQFPPMREGAATAEATPFYVADPYSCGRMAAQLAPRATLVVLVRVPGARAHSEYEMKHRRVESQDAFAALLGDHAAALLRCVVLAGPRNATQGLRACAPPAVEADAKFGLFAASVSAQLRRRLKSTPDAAAEFDELLGWARKCFWVEERGDGGAAAPGDDVYFPADLARRVFGAPDRAASSSRGPSWASSRGADRGPVRARDVHFDAHECFSEGTRERIGDLDGIIRYEIKQLLDCAKSRFPRWPNAFPPNGAEAAAYIGTCVRVRTGISNQYVYRSLYAAQLHRCVATGVKRRDLVVVDSDDLRNEPQAVLDDLADHAGLPHHAYDEALLHDATALQASITAKFPHFENSGWRLESSYAQPMPEQLRSYLARFFAPHNELLYEFAGRRFDWPDR